MTPLGISIAAALASLALLAIFVGLFRRSVVPQEDHR